MNWKNPRKILIDRCQMLAVAALLDAAIMTIIILCWR